MSNIFYLMGKSSSGKDTLYRKLMEQNRLLKGIVSYTTRPQRAGETDGKEYFFVTEDEMKEVLWRKTRISCVYRGGGRNTSKEGDREGNATEKAELRRTMPEVSCGQPGFL